MNDEDFMRLAIAKTKEGIKKCQTPFGACIVKKGRVVACEHNVVWKEGNPVMHAEVHAIRQACRKLKTIDLSGCIIYSTTEPCPMCYSAIHWARIKRIVYGASIADAKKAGFNELAISNSTMKKIGKNKIKIESGLLKKECVELFKTWKKHKGKAY
ncbi:MAG: nucleoside deaminase [Candidatus Nanoarchaeia archaeon]|nr:nucleoside deaminase [Candidatus Nanoarchaeia archaeon]